MSILCLSIGTVLSILFIIFLIKGQKYNYMTENLSGDDFPFPSLYCAGLAMQDIALFRAPERLGCSIRDNAKLIYGKKYCEYYSRIIWAQALSLGIFCCAVFMVLAGVIEGLRGLLMILAVVMVILPGFYFVNHVNEQVLKRKNESNRAFPNAIAKLSLMVNSGVILHDAWYMVAYGNNGVFYDLMQKSCQEIENGKADIDAINEFGYQTNSEEIKKFTSMLSQSIERGGGELPSFLTNQSREMWAHHRQVMLQKGEKAAGALLMPIALMFVGVMLLVIVAAIMSFAL